MTRILVLSDTHLPASAMRAPSRSGLYSGENLLLDSLGRYLTEADLILHAGDHESYAFYDALGQRGRLVAVQGNSDDAQLRHSLPERAVIECEGLRIGLTHGWGSDGDLPDRIVETWPEELPDIIVFGHSHQGYQIEHDGVLMFNPGSPTRPRHSGATFGWLEIDGSHCTPSVIALP